MVLNTISAATPTLQDGDGGILVTIFALCGIAVGLLLILAAVTGLWKMFEKAGEAGWEALIPFYNIWVLMEIIGRPGWWLILYFIPVVGTIIWIIVCLDLAKSFDHGIGFAIGLMLFPFIFYVLLGWGESQYQGAMAGK